MATTDDLLIRRPEPRDLPTLGRVGATLVRAHHAFDAHRFLSRGHAWRRATPTFSARSLRTRTWLSSSLNPPGRSRASMRAWNRGRGRNYATSPAVASGRTSFLSQQPSVETGWLAKGSDSARSAVANESGAPSRGQEVLRLHQYGERLRLGKNVLKGNTGSNNTAVRARSPSAHRQRGTRLADAVLAPHRRRSHRCPRCQSDRMVRHPLPPARAARPPHRRPPPLAPAAQLLIGEAILGGTAPVRYVITTAADLRLRAAATFHHSIIRPLLAPLYVLSTPCGCLSACCACPVIVGPPTNRP